ncbi:hypothetical protein OIO90_000214 [Microbotryomycetes sp. JL221]|nr:hypothetical protein OIO90_000214 [Microbotryomycetes sp. JL221]
MAHKRASKFQGVDEQALNTLMAAGGRDVIPTRAWISALVLMSRRAILTLLELPRLTSTEWQEVCRQRFPRSMVRRELDAINYLIAHRKNGLARNRVAAREMNTRHTFATLRVQNSLTEMSNIATYWAPRQYCPTDVGVKFWLSIGHSTFLTNTHCRELLDKLGFRVPPEVNNEGKSNVLGPVIVTAHIQADSDFWSPEGVGVADGSVPMSIDLEDLFHMTSKVECPREWWEARCEVKDGMGYR